MHATVQSNSDSDFHRRSAHHSHSRADVLVMAAFCGVHFLAVLLTDTIVDDPNHVIQNRAVFAVQFYLLLLHIAILTRERDRL